MNCMWKMFGATWKPARCMKTMDSALTHVASRSTLRFLVSILVAIAVTSHADATLFTVLPISFVSGPNYSITATGTIATAGNTSTINNWNLVVTTAERLVHYSPANTVNFSLDVSSDGQRLTVPTSPDGFLDGGTLFFRSPNPFLDFGVAVADFTNLNVDGGQAMYMAGGNFDFLPLNQPNAVDYVAAQARVSGGNLYDLVPLSFPGGVTVSGTIRTDGTTGVLAPSNIISWDIFVDMLTQDVFNPTNSVLRANQVGLKPTGRELTVHNPDGFLAFSKGSSGGHPYALQLADFTGQSPVGGQAGYFQGAFAVNTIDLHAAFGPWTVAATVLPPGDFDNDGNLDCQDVDALVAVIAADTNSVGFDLTSDALVNQDDLTAWLAAAGSVNLSSGGAYLPGDANLDGVVDGQDFIAWNGYKFTTTAAWCRGDFNADGVTDGQDFIVWNAHKFMSSDSASAVPEPGFGALLVALIIATASRTCRQ